MAYQGHSENNAAFPPPLVFHLVDMCKVMGSLKRGKLHLLRCELRNGPVCHCLDVIQFSIIFCGERSQRELAKCPCHCILDDRKVCEDNRIFI